MPKRLTVFYSWQSDTPSKLNRNFLEEALREALKRLHLDATLEVALRDATLELDKDTQGVTGSPPIAETILKKIEQCAVFVADLTFVGESMNGLTNQSGKGRLFSNPNVLIEYGYALRCHGHTALVGIMNTAYGKPDAATLPFDLRHLRWPITYDLTHSSDPEKLIQFEKLTTTLVDALRLILRGHTSVETPVSEFIPQKPTKNPAAFFDEPTDLIPEGRWEPLQPFTVPDEGRAYLRVYPTVTLPPIDTELDALNLAAKSTLEPMGRVSGWGHARNIFGAIVYEAPTNGSLYHFTQLFLNRELWGLDAHCLNATSCHRFTGGKRNGYIASDYVEEVFLKALKNYLKVAREFLGLPLPLRIKAGLVGIKGYPITVGHGFAGKMLQDHVEWEGEVASDKASPHEILEPFFARVWAKCGVERPARKIG